MVFKIKHLLLFILALSFAMSISRFLNAGLAFGIISLMALLVTPFVTKTCRRNYLYGGLTGAIFVLIATFTIANFFFGHELRRRGYHPQHNHFQSFVSYTVTTGFITGAAIGLLLPPSRNVSTDNSQKN